MNEPKIYSFDSSLLPDANPKDGFCVDLVRVGDYAALKAERDALAVENAALKSSVDLIASAYTEGEPAGFEIDRARHIETPATDAALAAIQAQAKSEAIEQMAIQLEQLPDEALEFLSDVAEFETYQEERHTFVSISNPRAVANAVISLVKEQSTELREAK
ncbi:hypothetical protein [Serratia sp. SCBI]|uniref:hypothetical protein n=1 Tax=Serratia sp. SCBI TaxID=488142 RepID=UPI0004F86C6C|nr:hypothetical protein [Serratia sp. SCBI]AIM22419.1 Eae protein [Serratia sp. SCBI]